MGNEVFVEMEPVKREMSEEAATKQSEGPKKMRNEKAR